MIRRALTPQLDLRYDAMRAADGRPDAILIASRPVLGHDADDDETLARLLSADRVLGREIDIVVDAEARPILLIGTHGDLPRRGRVDERIETRAWSMSQLKTAPLGRRRCS